VAALQAVERLGMRTALADDGTIAITVREGCPKCGAEHVESDRFCGFCGTLLNRNGRSPFLQSSAGERHIYHHHYHHHLVESSSGDINGSAEVRDSQLEQYEKIAEIESTLRKLVRDWSLYCNSKRLEELIQLYSLEAIVIRPNLPQARGQNAIRELLRVTIEAGLGDVELELTDTGILGEIACLMGRSRMLGPTSTGMREQTGKYLIVARSQAGSWKILADSWSIDTSPEELPHTH